MKTRIIPFFIPHAGCPYRCVYCDQRVITSQEGQVRGEDVARTIAEYLATGGEEERWEVAFYGGSFTALPPSKQRELLLPAFRVLQEGRIEAIRVSTRPDCLDEERLALLMAYGVTLVELGVQSMDDRVLRLAGRGHTATAVVEAAALLRSWGFNWGAQLMPGLPGAGPASDLFTARQIAALEPDVVRIYPAVVLAGTELHRMLEKGKYKPLSIEEAVERTVEMRLIFEERGIPVIRTGLQESPGLAAKVVAGPYHPAFGELVEGEIYFRQVDYYLEKIVQGGISCRKIKVAVNPQEVSKAIGHGRSNVRRWQEKRGIQVEVVGKEEVEAGNIVFLAVDEEKVKVEVKRQDFIKAWREKEKEGKKE